MLHSALPLSLLRLCALSGVTVKCHLDFFLHLGQTLDLLVFDLAVAPVVETVASSHDATCIEADDEPGSDPLPKTNGLGDLHGHAGLDEPCGA